MGIMHVLHRVALKYRGGTGVRQLADDLGVNYQVLLNKLNPNNNTHHVYAEDLDAMVAVLDTDEVAKHFAAQRSMVCIKVFEHPDLSDGALIDLLIGLEAEKAEWLEKIKEALLDGNVSSIELVRIKREYQDFVAAGAEVMARIESYMEASESRTRRKENAH